MTIVPLIEGNRILEIGHGPGHLQRALLGQKQFVVGIDESAQMGRLARRNPTRYSSKSDPRHEIVYAQINLTRGIAQQLPFSNESFDTVVATFPTEYITDPDTLSEVKRCLSGGGRLIALPAALPKNPFLDWLFRVTHQSPSEAVDVVTSRFKEPFAKAGFRTEVKILDVKSGTLLIVIATKEPI